MFETCIILIILSIITLNIRINKLVERILDLEMSEEVTREYLCIVDRKLQTHDNWFKEIRKSDK